MGKAINKSASFTLASKVKDYFQLIKFTLSFTVVFFMCYMLFTAPDIVSYDLKMIIVLLSRDC